jgi:hypothetical protein
MHAPQGAPQALTRQLREGGVRGLRFGGLFCGVTAEDVDFTDAVDTAVAES